MRKVETGVWLLQRPLSSGQLPPVHFRRMGEDSGQQEENDMGSCLTVAPKRFCPITEG